MAMSNTSERVIAAIASTGILPVITVHDLRQTAEVLDGLVEQGINAVEIVLRSPLALAAIAECRRRHPSLIVGAGTVLDEQTFEQALDHGSQFAVSPGATPDLLKLAASSPVPFIPGAVTASEIMLAMEAGLSVLKFFPATAWNAIQVLDDYRHLFPTVRFVTTGKINASDVQAYARIPTVLAVGGSWMLPRPGVAHGQALARESLKLFHTTRAREPHLKESP
jgi:2-dehydro-3-deoxyphosphogluconate aldolase / (4S)-4-hydroxy-2-oxoglutarate aldolase